MTHETQTPQLTLVSTVESSDPTPQTNETGLIEMPEHLRPVQKAELTVVGSEPELIDHVPGMEKPADGANKTQHDLAGTAFGGKFNNGVIPVDNPGPQAVRQAAAQPGSPIHSVGSATFVKETPKERI